MSMARRAAPIVVAGVAGILVGYLLAPNVTAVREDFAARFNEQTPLLAQLQSSVAGIETRLGTMPDAQTLNASITEQLTAAEGRLATQTDALGTRLGEQAGAVPQELTTGIEETRSSLDELRTQMETLSADVSSLREESEARASGPAQDEAGELAAEVGASGAVLLAGQAAIFGGTRLDLSELDVEAGTATLTPEGGEASAIAAGDTLEVSPTCTVRLAGVASNAAYLAPENCTEGAAADEPAVEPAATPANEQARAPAQAAPASDETNQPPAGEAPAGEQTEGAEVPAQGSQAVPDQQPGQAQENAPNAGQPQGGQPQPAQ